MCARHKIRSISSSGPVNLKADLWLAIFLVHESKVTTNFPQNTGGRCMRYLRSKNSFFTGVPFLILGRKVFNCQHGIDRTAGEKRKWKDAEEVLYIIISFYPQPLCYCQLWFANSKGQIHEWVIWHWSQNTFMTNVITVQSWLNWRWFRS